MRESIDFDGCCQYVLSRQCQQGGFCFYAYQAWGVEEPNAPDTHAAVAALGLLGRPLPRASECVAWLQEQQEADGSYSTLVIGYAAIKALHLLGDEPRDDPRPFLRRLIESERLDNPTGLEFAGWLSGSVKCIELLRDHGLPLPDGLREAIRTALSDRRQDDGGMGEPAANLVDTAHAATLASLLELPLDRRALDYAYRCRNNPIAFTLTPSTSSSSLDVQRAGIKLLRYFDAIPQHSAPIRDYVASCQTALGGFGRTPGAIAGLTETFCAIEILCALEPGGSEAAVSM